MKHILICGEIGVGKSTLAERLLEGCSLPVYGFTTKIMRRREDGFHEIYMFRSSDRERILTEENHLADCDSRNRTVHPEVFDGMGADYILEAKPDGIIVMDELGFLETGAERFCSAVLSALDGSIPVIATVKSTHKDVEFLNKVRNHPNAQLYYINRENRDELYEELRPLAEEMMCEVNAGSGHIDR